MTAVRSARMQTPRSLVSNERDDKHKYLGCLTLAAQLELRFPVRSFRPWQSSQTCGCSNTCYGAIVQPSRTLYKRFASVSQGMSGQRCQTDRAPMLVGTPFPVKLSACGALGRVLWMR